MKYRSKPTECEAMQWHDDHDGSDTSILECAEEIVAWVNANGGEAKYLDGKLTYATVAPGEPRIAVRTINGWACAAPGHYVVMGSSTFLVPPSPDPWDERPEKSCRDFYPCDPETFERRWEPFS